MPRRFVCTGNKYLHLLTKNNRQRVRLDLQTWDGKRDWVEHDKFEVGDEDKKFRLNSIGDISGHAGWYST